MNRTTEPEAALIDLDAAKARVHAALHPPVDAQQARATPAEAESALGGIKKRRSDAGTKRPPKPEPETALAGALSEAQWARIRVLAEQVTQAAVDRFQAAQAHVRAEAAFADYVDGLKRAAD
jgi:hypothetical protein